MVFTMKILSIFWPRPRRNVIGGPSGRPLIPDAIQCPDSDVFRGWGRRKSSDYTSQKLGGSTARSSCSEFFSPTFHDRWIPTYVPGSFFPDLFFSLSLIFALNSIRHFEENFPSTLANPIALHTTNDHKECCTSAYLTLSKSSGSLMNVLKC